MTNSRRKTALLYLVMTTALVGVRSSSDAHAQSIDDVLDVWRDRQEWVESLHIAWRLERTDMKGSMTSRLRLFEMRNGRSTADPVPFPPEDTTTVSECELFTKGKLSRYTFDGEFWHLARDGESRVFERKATYVYDGAQLIEFDEEASNGVPQGVIQPGQQNFAMELADCRPIMWCYWPLDTARGGVDEEGLSLTGETLSIDGREHWAVAERLPQRSDWKFWVDPERDFMIRRVTSEEAPYTKRAHVFDIHHEQSPGGDWRLAHWTLQHLKEGELTSHYEATVESVRINGKLSDALFTIEFPPGTVVSEYTEGSTRSVDSLVHEDGVARPLSRRYSSYEDLLRGENTRDTGTTQIVLWVNAGLLFVLFLAVVLWRLKRRRGDQP